MNNDNDTQRKNKKLRMVPIHLGIRILSISFEMERPPVNGGDLLHNYPRSKIGHII